MESGGGMKGLPKAPKRGTILESRGGKRDGAFGQEQSSGGAACGLRGVVESALNLRVDVVDMGRGLGLGESGKVSPL